MKTRSGLRLLCPVVLAMLGTLWMQVAVSHYEHKTGRAFYGLVGYHYTVPAWGFKFHPGGEVIQRWTTEIPPTITLILIFVSFGAAVAAERKRKSGWSLISSIALVHILVGAAFVLVATWYDINITGFFV